MDTLRRRFAEAKGADESRNTLIEDLLQRVDDLEKTMDRNAFVLVLIDGDCMNFLNDLVKSGIPGGEEAARLLRRAVFEYLRYEEAFKHDHKIVIRVYASLRGLTKAYVSNGILPYAAAFHEFVLGFNRAHPLCDFIDAGNAKEAADTKLKESLTLYMHNVHCKQIVFGASADNGYASFLSSFSVDTNVSSRVRLLMGPEFSREFRQILPKFKWTEFKDVFRSEFIADENTHPAAWRRNPVTEPKSQQSTWRPSPHSARSAVREQARDAENAAQTIEKDEDLSLEGLSLHPSTAVAHPEGFKSPLPIESLSVTEREETVGEAEVYNALINATYEVLEDSPRALDFGVVKNRAAQELGVPSGFWGKGEQEYWFHRSKDMIKHTVENWVELTNNPPPKNATWMLWFFPPGTPPSSVISDPSSYQWRTQDPRTR